MSQRPSRMKRLVRKCPKCRTTQWMTAVLNTTPKKDQVHLRCPNCGHEREGRKIAKEWS